MGCRLSGPWMSDGTMGVSAQDLRYIRNHEALRILASCEQPITVQIEGRRGRGLQYHRSSDSSTQTKQPWDVSSDRPCYSHMTLPGNHGDGGRYEYLPNTPRDLEDMRTVPRHDPEFSPKAAQKQNCLLSCCNSNMEEPSSFQSQTEDEDYVLEKKLGYLPLHHELDSGLGWTDGSFHQGELSGVETEEGLEECHAHQGGRGARVRGGSPSSESFISSELSDSGFYSVSTAEFLRFQRLLEKRMRVYNSRLHHQGELQNLCMDAQKAHRELEAIPEALAPQQDSECVEADAHPQQTVRVASMPLRKSERPCLNCHSSSSATIFSTCSSPSGQQRPPHGTPAAGMLRRSRTLHHRPVHVEQRRRASHPASPNYCSVTLNHYGHALQPQLTEETEADVLYNAKYNTHHVNQPAHHANHRTHHANHPVHHANHSTHHANHPTHHASYPTHNAHLANYTTMHANHPAHTMHHTNYPTHIANQAAHNANNLTHSKQQANLPARPYHATLPAQHTHHTQATFTSQAPHHSHTHATLPTQHTHHAHSPHSMHHGHAHVTLPTQLTHHAHDTPAAHAAHPGHAHIMLPTQDSHHIHDTLTPHSHTHTAHPAQHTPHTHTAHPAQHPPHTHTVYPAQHTPHTHTALPAQHTPQTHTVYPAQHTPHTHTALPAQHTPQTHTALPAQHTPHTHTTFPAQHTPHTHTTFPAQHTPHTHTTFPAQHTPHTHATLPAQHAHHMSRTRPKHAMSQPSLSSSTDDHHFAPPPESYRLDNRGRSFTEPSTGGIPELEKEPSGDRERGRFHTLSHTPSQEGNDTWPKTTNRHGPYSTLQGHVTTMTAAAGKSPAGAANPRAMRNQLLRERALRLADERSGGISTDDETNVEIRRAGRYWSRSERREQVLQKQRQKREALRGGGANSNPSVGGDSSGYNVLMELSQRKLSRLRNRKLLDDWTTVEELLTHGTRLGTHDENIQIPNSLLTVTTV
ncbi:filaggrin-2 [Hemibagrus wyckioides]|uniref:filaggrin-2 n=1 Tax=Hemibagrus wyckioides TaxID=337641 RepID=UPI00266BC71C|nr:filaggrin-2 [Hemibagrus wyckioides]